MTNALLESASARLEAAKSVAAEARNALERAESEIRRWESFLASYSELTGTAYDMQIQSEFPHVGNDASRRKHYYTRAASSRGRTMEETEEKVAQLLSELKRPVPTRELVMFLAERGYEVGGQEPVSTLSARLSRSQRFVSDRKYGWMTKEMADGAVIFPDPPSANQPQSGPVEPEAGGGT